MKPTLTFDELIALTTVNDCTECGLRHAAVRSCEDAKSYNDLKNGDSK